MPGRWPLAAALPSAACLPRLDDGKSCPPRPAQQWDPRGVVVACPCLLVLLGARCCSVVRLHHACPVSARALWLRSWVQRIVAEVDSKLLQFQDAAKAAHQLALRVDLHSNGRLDTYSPHGNDLQEQLRLAGQPMLVRRLGTQRVLVKALCEVSG